MNSARKQREDARQRFNIAARSERTFARALASVARQVGAVIRGLAPDGVVSDQAALRSILSRYSETIRPWASTVVRRMHAELARRDATAWERLARTMGRSLRREIESTPATAAELMQEQVELITSLPVKAAERVHHLTREAIVNSTRASEIAQEILKGGKVTASRARMIARTEVARTASVLTESRAQSVGSNGYFWRTAGDSDVRLLHKKLNGKFIEWDKPPVSGENGERAHAGQIYNCRCYPEPVLEDE